MRAQVLREPEAAARPDQRTAARQEATHREEGPARPARGATVRRAPLEPLDHRAGTPAFATQRVVKASAERTVQATATVPRALRGRVAVMPEAPGPAGC